MASSSKYFSLFLLFIVLFALQSEAREPKSFSKASATVPENTVVENTEETQTKPQESDPNFLPESENGYGLYGEKKPVAAVVNPAIATTQYNGESGQFFGSGFPKNYNPDSYVTGSESESRDEIKDNSNPQKQNHYMFDERNVDNEEDEEPTEYKNRYNYNYNSGGGGGGSRFSSRTEGQRAAALRGGRGGYFPGVDAHPQGMSDTRALQNGKYFYDIGTEKYNSNHPFETLKASSSAGNKHYYSNRRNYGNAFAGENSYGRFPANQQNEFREEVNYGGYLP